MTVTFYGEGGRKVTRDLTFGNGGVSPFRIMVRDPESEWSAERGDVVDLRLALVHAARAVEPESSQRRARVMDAEDRVLYEVSWVVDRSDETDPPAAAPPLQR